jgi:branched-subunit amino acid aminotransferase/4-amino-4-deoxychorismate lyase
VPTEELVFPYWDDISGTIRGYRVFTACRTVRGKVFRLEDHFDRLYTSAASIHMTPPIPRDELRRIVNELIARNREQSDSSELLLDVVFSGGLEGATMQKGASGSHLYIAVQPLTTPPLESYQTGVALAVFPHQRLYADVKLLNYVGAIIAHQTVVPQHRAYDVLFVCPEDRQTILEGSTFTIFFVDASGVVLTPPLDGRILDSISRRVVLELLRGKGRPQLKEVPIRLDQVPSFREAFLASTTRNVLPVSRLDDQVVGDGAPGEMTREVMRLFEEYVSTHQ